MNMSLYVSIYVHIHERIVLPFRLELEISDVDMLLFFSSPVFPRPCILFLSFWYVRADLSRKSAVLNMAGHPSISPQAVRTPFNTACNFPGEAYKSHKQNFNAVKYLWRQ